MPRKRFQATLKASGTPGPKLSSLLQGRSASAGGGGACRESRQPRRPGDCGGAAGSLWPGQPPAQHSSRPLPAWGPLPQAPGLEGCPFVPRPHPAEPLGRPGGGGQGGLLPSHSGPPGPSRFPAQPVGACRQPPTPPPTPEQRAAVWTCPGPAQPAPPTGMPARHSRSRGCGAAGPHTPGRRDAGRAPGGRGSARGGGGGAGSQFSPRPGPPRPAPPPALLQTAGCGLGRCRAAGLQGWGAAGLQGWGAVELQGWGWGATGLGLWSCRAGGLRGCGGPGCKGGRI